MISDHAIPIPGSSDPGSTNSGQDHNLPGDPPITTALLLDPTVHGYRLDSKLVAELSAPLPKTRFPPLLFLLVLILLPCFLGTLVVYLGLESQSEPAKT